MALRPTLIFMAIGNSAQVDQYTEWLERGGEHMVISVTRGGQDALELLEVMHPDVLLLDMFLPGLDGFAVLERLSASPLVRMPRVVALSPLAAHREQTLAKGADAFYLKSAPVEALLEAVREVRRKDRAELLSGKTEERMAQVKLLLNRLGMPSRLKGYQYLVQAVELVSGDMDLMRPVTQRLYPMVAELFQTTAVRVERGIRHAIEATWNRGDMREAFALFGNSVDSERGKPTNVEFIAALAEHVRLRKTQ